MKQNQVSEQLEQFYDKDAGRYRDAQWFSSSSSKCFYQATKEVVLSEARLTGQENVLEVGCGPGTWTNELQPLAKNIIAIDLSSQMLAQARQYVPGDNVEFHHGEFLSFDFGEKRFDRIISVRVLEYFTDTYSFLKKCLELLRPGGRIVLVTKTPSAVWKYRAALLRNFRFLWPRSYKKIIDVPAKEGYNKMFWQRLSAPSVLRKQTLSLGFLHCKTMPVLSRFPIIDGGYSELPILSGRIAERYLVFSAKFTKWSQSKGQFINTIASSISESYALIADSDKK